MRGFPAVFASNYDPEELRIWVNWLMRRNARFEMHPVTKNRLAGYRVTIDKRLEGRPPGWPEGV